MSAYKGEFSWIFFVPTFVLLGFACFFLIKNIRVMTTFERTSGKIVRFDAEQTNNRQTVYQTIVTYKTTDGTEREAGSLTRSNSVSKNIGDTVTVYYNPAHPEQAHVHTFRDTWLHILLLGGIGGILFIIWYGILVGVPPAGAPPGTSFKAPSDF